MRSHHLLIVSVALVAVLLVPTGGAAQMSAPLLEARVTDLTNTLSQAETQSLEKQLKACEDLTSTQIFILLVPSLKGAGVNEFAANVFVVNQIGHDKKNKGVLLLVAIDGRKVGIEVGDALTRVLTGAVRGQIIAREIEPNVQREKFYAGLVSGVDAIKAAVAGEYKVDEVDMETPLIVAGVIVLGLLTFFIVFRPMVRSRRNTFIGSVGHRYQSGWGYGRRPSSRGPSSGKPSGGATGHW